MLRTAVAVGAPRHTLWAAVEAVGGPQIRVISLDDRICGPTTCPAVVGGVIVCSDYSHLTTTYARTLVPHLRRDLVRTLREAE